MRVLFGQKNLETHDADEKRRIARVPGYFIKGMRIVLAVIFIFTFWMGPYNIIKIHTSKEISGKIQTLDMWETSEYRHPGNKHYYIGITVDEKEYVIHMDYVDQDWLKLAGTIHDYLGTAVTVRYIDDWVPLSREKMIIDLEANGALLIDSGRLYSIWMKRAVGDTLTGTLAFALLLLIYLRETGRFRVIWK